LSLQPETIKDSKGQVHKKKAVRRLGFKHCFVEKDLYTTRLGLMESTEIEQMFFGPIDTKGRSAVEYFTKFTHPTADGDAFKNLILYLSTQKLRTPKGLGWLSDILGTTDRNKTLIEMQKLQQLYGAIWTECVWQIADASRSETKFIISDHPVAAYNRRCGPRSMWCRGYGDPNIAFHGTHTIFPLSLEKILILTNLSWIRNPYQSEVGLRPNPNPWRTTFFNFTDVQTLRYLTEQEVREINFIIKSRSFRYVAAAREEWLYPENYVSKSDWNCFGRGYLLMPDPRAVTIGGTVIMGYSGGGSEMMDEYGHRPWHSDFDQKNRRDKETESLYRFKGEFARLFGPQRRGRAFNLDQLDEERDDEEFHKYHLGLERTKGKRNA
jgi:hypothetical protein